MSNGKWWLIGIAGWTLVLAALVAGRREQERSVGAPHSTADVREEVRQLRAELAALRRQANETRLHIMTSAVASSAAVSPAAAEPELEQLVAETYEEREARAKERQREIFTSLEARLAGEQVDAEWSRDTERQIHEVAAAQLRFSHVESAECGGSLCRVVLRHESREEQATIGNTLPRHEPFREGVVYEFDFESEPAQTTLFLLRAGRSFEEDASQR
jgi:hypothetical protein